MKKILLLILLFPIVAFGQYEKKIDSLKQVIASKIPNDKKAETYHALLQIYFSTDLKESKKYIQELYDLNTNNSCLKCEALADLNNGFYYYMTADNKNSILYYEKSAKKCLSIKDYENYENAKMQLVQTYMNTSDIDKSETELNNLLAFKKKNNLTKNTEYVYYLKGQLNIIKGFNKIAIENLLLAEKTILDYKSPDFAMRITINNMIVTLYANLKNFEKAREYNENALLIAKESKSEDAVNSTKLYRGFLETSAKNYVVAENYLLNAHKYYTSANNGLFRSISALFLGKVYFNLKEYSKSLQYSNVAIDFYSKNNQTNEHARALVNRANVKTFTGEFIGAKSDIDLAKDLLKDKVNSKDYLEILDAEIQYSRKNNKIDDAIKAMNLKDSLKQLLDVKTNLASLNEVEAQYQNEKKQEQIKLLSAENELAKKQLYIYIGLLGLLVIIGGSLFYGYRNKIKTAQKLTELNTLKSRFFANISHEFRTPLTLIKSPVQSLQASKTDEDQKNQLNLIDQNANRMLELVDQLLELSKIDSGHLKLIFKDGNISSFLASIMEPFDFQSKENGINFTHSIQKTNENSTFDKDVIEKIVTNLISNAFKYTAEKEAITFHASIENATLKLLVSNTGSVLKKEDLPKLFERFYQKNESQQGVGIGLALVKELVDLYQGTITTTIDNGALSFIVELPLTVANQNAVKIPTKVEIPIVTTKINNESELPLLLIVDDNADIRSVLNDIFKHDYQILEAQDGIEGLQLAQSAIPDCIISDVMMPKLDGFEFTKQVKSNELTSFIPIVLLTAKTSEEAHLEGLKSTADVFLTKPFNNEVIKQTVNQLIAERKKLHARYSQELVLKPVDIVINSVEEKFIEKLQVILDKNLSNSEYSAEDFATEIGVSRMQLHRKLKSLLGVSATEFLRLERLKIGAELLKQSNGNISEVAYAVGFNDLSYFSKCFKEMYHCTPTEYIEKNKIT